MTELQSFRSMLDGNFIQDLPKELRCPICLDLLSDPHLISCCGKYFCYSCLSKAYQSKGPVCPVCSQQYTCVRDPNVVRRINALRVECPNKSHGCDWVGEYEYFNKHVKERCGYMVTFCKLGCGQYISRMYLEKHNEFLCPNRVYDCQYCGKYRNTFKDVEENHWPVCDRFPVPCPNDCPSGSVPRGRLMDHLKKECQMRQQLTRARAKSISLEQSVEDLEKVNAELEEENQKLKDKLVSSNEESAQLYEQIQQLEYELSSNGERNRELLARSKELEQQVKFHKENEEKLRKEIELKNEKDDEEAASKRQSLLHNPNLMLQWTQCSSLPEVLCEASAVLCGGYVYTGGGICQRMGTYDNACTVFKYDYNRDFWSKLPTTKRHKFTLVALHGKIVVVGGKIPDGDHLKTLLEWGETWTESFPPMNRFRKEATAVGHGDHIAVAGGSNESGSLSSVEVFSSNTKQWYLAKSLPLALSKASSALLNSHWYLIGGKEKAACSISIDSLVRKAMNEPGSEDEDAKWESLTDTPSELSTAAAFGGCLLAIGGKTVHAYMDGRRYWIPINFPHPLTIFSAAAVALSPFELLVIGGYKGFSRYPYTYKATLEQFS